MKIKRSTVPLCPRPCELCRGADVKAILRKNGYSIVECNRCGLVYVAETVNDLRKFYDRDYYKGLVYKDYIAESKKRVNIFRKKLNLIMRWMPGGKLLDIGCAAGFFLDVARRCGWEVFGVEISEFSSRYARERLGIDVFTGQLKDAQFKDNYFDVITMWDTIEHLQNPFDTLVEIHRILKKHGLLVIETLNVSSLNARLLRSSWPLYGPPYHLFYFSKKTIAELLLKSGFQAFVTIPVQTYVLRDSGYIRIKYFDIRAVVKLANLLNLADVILVLAKKSESRTLT